jgi:hypothetical protein
MDVKLYTGNGSSQSITGLGFSPDFVWVKSRDEANTHNLYDIVRGTGKELVSNTTAAEASYGNSLTSFDSTGFGLGSASWMNGSSKSYVAWTWDAGSSTVTNTQGSISSQVRANASAGFSVVGFDAGAGGQVTMGHGLGVAPSLIILKRRTAVESWYVWTQGFTTSEYLILNGTSAKTTSTNLWGTSLPSSTLFGYNANSGTHVAYCFAPVAGYSSFGSYTGNGSADGPFVYTGFRPAFVLMKRSDATSDWWILDNKRSAAYNVVDGFLYPNGSGGEAVAAALDILSNGFKMRRTSPTDVNANGGTYIYAAFAEHPFQYARAR